jgi:hypothetical protein
VAAGGDGNGEVKFRRRGPGVNLKCLWRLLARVITSLLCGGVFYFAWMAVFFLATGLDGPAVEVVLWLLAPVVTATGFATGIVTFDRLTSANEKGFLRVFTWPLIGCAIGAGVAYWFGPMLIVFGMFVAGAASIALREVVAFHRDARA